MLVDGDDLQRHVLADSLGRIGDVDMPDVEIARADDNCGIGGAFALLDIDVQTRAIKNGAW